MEIIKRIERAHTTLRMYGLRMFWNTYLYGLLSRASPAFPFTSRLVERKHRRIESEIEKSVSDIISQTRQAESSSSQPPSDPRIIWWFWWQGIETAPEIVKMCFDSVRKHSEDRRIIVIDRASLSKYVTLPTPVLKKVENQSINITQFSDIVRMALLSKYGGLWIDATIYLAGKIDIPPSLGFYTNRRRLGEPGCISAGRWTIFFMYCAPDCLLPRFVYECLISYWATHEKLIDYLLTDYIIDLGYRTIPEIRELIDQVPFNNEGSKKLTPLLNRAMSGDHLQLIDSSVIHKLNWKTKYSESTSGVPTVYGYLLNESSKAVQ